MINAFSSNLNTVNLHLKIKPRSFYKIMEGFILKVNSWEISKVVPCLLSIMLTLTWGIDISFEKLALETGGWIWKTPFSLCFWVGVGISCKACGWRLGVEGNYACYLASLLYLWDLEEQRGRGFKVIISREGRQATKGGGVYGRGGL